MSGTGKLTVGSLFAGIGGFDLGLERTGCFETKWFCEVDPYARRVLAKHWPGTPCHGDIRHFHARSTCPISGGCGEDLEPVDVLCGGFPCQDISLAGRGAGLAGARSGLWSEYARLVRELRPRYVVVENVPALRKRGLEVVLADLLACGYDAEWDGIPAAAAGAPHQRDRIWIVAYPNGGRREPRVTDLHARESDAERCSRDLADANCIARESRGPGDTEQGARGRDASRGGLGTDALAHPHGERELQPQGRECNVGRRPGHGRRQGRGTGALAHPDSRGRNWRPGDQSQADGRGEPPNDGRPSFGHDWTTEPDVGRVAHGVPARVDRLRSLGNALVPQIAEWLGYRIAEHEGLI